MCSHVTAKALTGRKAYGLKRKWKNSDVLGADTLAWNYTTHTAPPLMWRRFGVGGRKSVGTSSSGSILWGWEERSCSRTYGSVPPPVRKLQGARGSENCRTKIFTNAEFTKPKKHALTTGCRGFGDDPTFELVKRNLEKLYDNSQKIEK